MGAVLLGARFHRGRNFFDLLASFGFVSHKSSFRKRPETHILSTSSLCVPKRTTPSAILVPYPVKSVIAERSL